MTLLVFTGDSHTDGTGAPPGRAWPAQLLELLDRPGLQILNTARAGAALAEQVARWQEAIAPALRHATGAIVFGMGGYNDATRDSATASDILATYRRQARLAHDAGARYVCGLDVIRRDPGQGTLNATIRQVNAVLRSEAHSFSDAQIDFAAEPLFDRPDGPYPRPPFADDEIHLDAEGQLMMARMAIPAYAALL